jgi:hypothetical protein
LDLDSFDAAAGVADRDPVRLGNPGVHLRPSRLSQASGGSDRNQSRAEFVLGLLTFKQQFCLLVPVALLTVALIGIILNELREPKRPQASTTAASQLNR